MRDTTSLLLLLVPRPFFFFFSFDFKIIELFYTIDTWFFFKAWSYLLVYMVISSYRQSEVVTML